MLAAWFATVNGWKTLAVIMGAAAVHEFGHWWVLRILGARILEVRVGILGAVIEADRQNLSYGGELAATLAGPLANLLGAMLAVTQGWEMAAGAHLALGGFNLLPIRPLDGGHALYLLLAWWLTPETGDAVCRWTGIAMAVFLAAGLAWLMVWSGGSLWLFPVLLGALAAAGRECFGKESFL